MKENFKKTLLLSTSCGLAGLSISHFILKKGTKTNILATLIGLGIGALSGYFLFNESDKILSENKKQNRIIKFIKA
jgi:hypothetical protein